MPPTPAKTKSSPDVSGARERAAQLLMDCVTVACNLLATPDLRSIAAVLAAAVDAALRRNMEGR